MMRDLCLLRENGSTAGEPNFLFSCQDNNGSMSIYEYVPICSQLAITQSGWYQAPPQDGPRMGARVEALKGRDSKANGEA